MPEHAGMSRTAPIPRKSGLLAPTILSAATPWRDRFEFDTSQFESWHPSQPPGSLHRNFGHLRKYRRFRRLPAKSPVSGEEIQGSRAEGGEFRSESLLADFQYPKFRPGAVERPVRHCTEAPICG
jgi:hypothetical protein